jgi:hypothetical protein
MSLHSPFHAVLSHDAVEPLSCGLAYEGEVIVEPS